MSRNDEIATPLKEFADLLEAKDAACKPSSYRRAAGNVHEHPTPIEELAEAGEDTVQEIDHIGDTIAAKTVEYVEAGRIKELEGLRECLPVDTAGLTNIEDVGPKTVEKLYETLGVSDLDDLETVARDGEIQEVRGFDAGTETSILDGIEFTHEATDRELLGRVRPVADDLLTYLGNYDAVRRIEPAGSMRQWYETMDDIDMLAKSADAEAVINHSLTWDLVGSTIEAGERKASVRMNGMRVDLRVVEPSEYGATSQYFTGNRDHNVRLCDIAIDYGLKMNEYGIFDTSDMDDPDNGLRAGTRVADDTEASMYAALSLPLVPPELREDTDEIEHAADNDLLDLLAGGDLRGDLHTHTDRSDGDNSITETVTAAAERGYDYHVVTDHATGPGMVSDVSVADDDLLDQTTEVRTVANDADTTVFTDVEANTGAEGGIPVADDVLDQLDVVVASPHSALDQDRETATERLITVMKHPAMNVLGHPTGWLINQRPGLPLDYERLMKAAVEYGVALELNASPYRLDLNGEALKIAAEAGATVAIDTDTHRPDRLDHARYGVHATHYGWVETANVLNTRSVGELSDFLA